MGHFGYHPRDNDGAMDLIGMVEDSAAITAMAMFGHDVGDGGGPFDHRYWERKWERLGVIEFMVEARMSLPKRLVGHALRELRELVEGEASQVFFDSFTNPAAARRAARNLGRKLSAMEPELPFGIVRAANKGKVPRRPKRKSTATKRKPRLKKPTPKTKKTQPRTKRTRS
jgi:hypothetical protein